MTTQETPRETARRRLVAAFTEWERRYRERPEQFMSGFEAAAQGCAEYGEAAAAYLIAILDDIPFGPQS